MTHARRMLALVAALVAVAAIPAGAVNVGDYEVDVIRCPNQGSNLFLPFTALSDASQQEVDSIVYQDAHPGVTNQVRLVQVTQVSPTKVTTLISQHTLSCVV
jgi:hypothetical protein